MMTLDRRCQRMEEAQAPPEEARTAERMLEDLSGETETDEWGRWLDLARGTPFDVSGIPALRLTRELDVAWPCVAEDQPGTVRLDATSAKAAEFVRTPPPADLPRPSAERPLLLVVGPLSEHAGSRVRTGRTPELHYEAPVPQLELHPEDAGAEGLVDGDWVTVESDTGSATVRVWLTDRVAKGSAFLPEHFGSVSDLQGGATAQDEPEGLAQLVVGVRGAADGDAPSALPAPVSVRKARRRDLRQRGV
jgi:anaerobic selenocysteine-containing dehydrogenase